MTILEPIFFQKRSRVAAGAGDTPITYGRLCDDIDSMAHWLLGTHGLSPGDRVTLHVGNPGNPDYWDWIMHLGAIRAGLAQSTGGLPPAIAATGKLGPYAAAIGMVDKLGKGANPAKRIPFAPAASAPLARQIAIDDRQHNLEGLEQHSSRLLSTSGTTGRPKVIRWDHTLFAGRLDQVRAIGDIGRDTVLLTLLGLITTTGLRYPLAAWQIGATVLLPSIGEEKTDMVGAADTCTFLATSPFRMQDFLRHVPGEWAGKETRLIELFGGRVPPLLREQCLSRCCSTLRMSYGATEVGRVAAGDTSLVDRNPGAVGMIEPGVTVEIVDPQGAPRPAGEPGIVRMKSAYMVDGYIGQPPVRGANTPFRDGWFYPGDIGILYEDGLFAITGRNSEAINISGAKLSPIVLEERLGELPEIQDVCVVAMQLDQGDVLTAAVVCAHDVDLVALRQKMAGLVPRQFPFMVAKVEKIPRNAMGRIPRTAVARMLTRKAKENIARRSGLQGTAGN